MTYRVVKKPRRRGAETTVKTGLSHAHAVWMAGHLQAEDRANIYHVEPEYDA